MVMPTQANGLSHEDPVQGLLHKGPAATGDTGATLGIQYLGLNDKDPFFGM